MRDAFFFLISWMYPCVCINILIKYVYGKIMICIRGEVMARILPSSDLRNKYGEISTFCNTYNEPVFITKNGTGDLVVLSNNAYEELAGRRELHKQLDEGLMAMKNGGGRLAKDVFGQIKREYGFDEV